MGSTPQERYLSEFLASDKYEYISEAWNTITSIYGPKGIDIPGWLEKQTDEISNALSSEELLRDFDELRDEGCAPPILALILKLYRASPDLEQLWIEVAGAKSKRTKVAKQLELAAEMLEDVYPKSLTECDTTPQQVWDSMGHIAPQQLISGLWFYADALKLDQKLADETESRSIREFAMYLLSSYVLQVTGDWRDRNVSALLSNGDDIRTEEAHRMWRNRNYDRLNQHFIGVTEIVHDFGILLSHTT